VSNCGVYPLSYTQDPTDIASIVNNFGRCLAAPLRKSPIPLSGDLKYNITRAPSDLKDFFTPPDVVVSFGGGNLSEQVDVKMTQMGFRKDSQGRRAFYRGSLSKDKIPSILELGSKILSYTFALNSCIMTPMRSCIIKNCATTFLRSTTRVGSRAGKHIYLDGKLTAV